MNITRNREILPIPGVYKSISDVEKTCLFVSGEGSITFRGVVDDDGVAMAGVLYTVSAGDPFQIWWRTDRIEIVSASPGITKIYQEGYN